MTQPPRELNPVAAVLAWVLPGLGHISLGAKKRGFAMMFGVLFLFILGVLIGGVDVVDHKEDRLWFLAQAGAGPVAFLADLVNQNVVKGMPDLDRFRAVSLGRINEMGTLFAALAGLMNVVLILDCLHYRPLSSKSGRPGSAS